MAQQLHEGKLPYASRKVKVGGYVCTLSSVGNLQAEVGLGKDRLGKCHSELQKLS